MNDSVKHRQEFSHTGSECDFFKFTFSDKSVIERFDRGIIPDSRKNRHIEPCSNCSAATANPATSPKGAAVTVHGRKTDKSGDLATVEFAEFR